MANADAAKRKLREKSLTVAAPSDQPQKTRLEKVMPWLLVAAGAATCVTSILLATRTFPRSESTETKSTFVPRSPPAHGFVTRPKQRTETSARSTLSDTFLVALLTGGFVVLLAGSF